jgi:hypothetical protein
VLAMVADAFFEEGWTKNLATPFPQAFDPVIILLHPSSLLNKRSRASA